MMSVLLTIRLKTLVYGVRGTRILLGGSILELRVLVAFAVQSDSCMIHCHTHWTSPLENPLTITPPPPPEFVLEAVLDKADGFFFLSNNFLDCSAKELGTF